jgi:hypothetical protein
MVDPPLFDGAVNVTEACAFPAVAVPIVGAPGTVTVAGVTLFEAADAAPVPTELVAVTINVYAVPLVRPLTVIGLAVAVPVRLPGFDVAVYPVIVAPPLLDGAVKVTKALAL